MHGERDCRVEPSLQRWYSIGRRDGMVAPASLLDLWYGKRDCKVVASSVVRILLRQTRCIGGTCLILRVCGIDTNDGLVHIDEVLFQSTRLCLHA